MQKYRLTYFILASSLLLVSAGSVNAQTIGYAQAIDHLAVNCGRDIDRFCRNVNLGGARVQQCLANHQASVSAICKTTINQVRVELQARAAARAAVMQVCDADIRRLCAGVQPGDANLLECFFATKQNVSERCKRAVANAGYETSISSTPVKNQINLSAGDIVNSLQGVAAATSISAASLQQLVLQSLHDPSRANPMNRPPLSAQLGTLAQISIAIEFNLGSARIKPESFKAVGMIADALYSPYLQGYHFLIVGHTDARGGREYNLKLSQRRADAVREALINPFGISPSRIQAVGVGEEQFLDPGDPYAAQNRRVQLINIGK